MSAFDEQRRLMGLAPTRPSLAESKGLVEENPVGFSRAADKASEIANSTPKNIAAHQRAAALHRKAADSHSGSSSFGAQHFVRQHRARAAEHEKHAVSLGGGAHTSMAESEGVPSDVKRYEKGILKKGSGPKTDKKVSNAMATAWSIYCKHKNPDSPHCKRPPSGYLRKK